MLRVIEIKDNKVNLCDSCRKTYPECDCRNILFGDGKGEDNICCCNAYTPKGLEIEDANRANKKENTFATEQEAREVLEAMR